MYSAGEGQGSTFTLKIPLLNKAHQAQAQEEVDADMRSSALLAHGPPPRLTQLLNNVASSQAHSQTHSFEGTQSTLLIEDTDRDWDRVGDHTAIPIGTEDLLFALQREDTEDSVCCYESSTFIPETSAIDPHPDPVHFKCMQLCIPMHAAAAPPPSPETPVVDLSHQRFKILVVDDSKLNRKMLVKSLKTERHSCDEAEDGLEAVRMVTKMSESKTDESSSLSCPYSYDAILMDFMMPIMDGPTATKALRDMGYTGVIIGVTGNALPSDVAYFTGKGADKVLIKPVDVDVLLLTVHALLGASRADRTDLVWTTGK